MSSTTSKDHKLTSIEFRGRYITLSWTRQSSDSSSWFLSIPDLRYGFFHPDVFKAASFTMTTLSMLDTEPCIQSWHHILWWTYINRSCFIPLGVYCPSQVYDRFFDFLSTFLPHGEQTVKKLFHWIKGASATSPIFGFMAILRVFYVLHRQG